MTATALVLAAAAPAAATTGPVASITGGNLFLGTTKVEMGARANGSFGSAVAAPAGFTPRTNTGTILGFRVNDTECAWTDPACVTQGDFFTPGIPYEAWGIQIGSGSPAYNDHTGTGVAGAFTSSDGPGTRGVWESSGSFGGAISVQLTYSLPTYGWLIDTEMRLTNTSGATVHDVYVMRGLDPDNCRMESRTLCDTNGDGVADVAGTAGGGEYRTRQRIVAQGTASTAALVTATQTNDSYLGLRALGEQARVYAKNANFGNPANLATLWSGGDAAYGGTVGATQFGDNGVYAVVRVPSIAPGGTATVRIQYVVKEVPPAAEITVTAPVPPGGGLIDVLGGNPGGAVLRGICTQPQHGTAQVEGDRVRYTPTPGYSGPDAFEYSTGGPCGRVTLTVAAAEAAPPVAEPTPAAPAPAAPGRDDRVAVPGTPLKTTRAARRVRASARLTLPLAGRYTFIYEDAAGKRVGMLKGSTVGSRTLRRRFSAPVLVTTTDGAQVRIAATLIRKNPKGLRLRIIRRLADGALSEIVIR